MKFSSLPMHASQYLPYLALAFIAVLLSVLFIGETREWLSFDPSVAFSQQWWTLLTRHFIHTNTPHLLINLFGLFLIWMLYGDYFARKQAVVKFISLFVLLSISTSILTFWFSDTDARFIGLSGVLHGLFMWGVIQDIRFKINTAYLLLFGLLVKLGQEQFFENSAFMANIINADVAVDSHLYGAVSGLIFGLILKGENKSPNCD